MDPSRGLSSLILHINWNYLLHLNRTILFFLFPGAQQWVLIYQCYWSSNPPVVVNPRCRHEENGPQAGGRWFQTPGRPGRGAPPHRQTACGQAAPTPLREACWWLWREARGRRILSGEVSSVSNRQTFSLNSNHLWKEEESESIAIIPFLQGVPHEAKAVLTRGWGRISNC